MKIRLELFPIAVGLWAAAGLRMALSFVTAILVHEAAHWLTARLLDPHRSPLTLQLGGGGSYVREIERRGTKAAILAAGPLAGILLALSARALAPLSAGSALEPFFRELFYVSAVWTVYQSMPFPPLDGGQLLRLLLDRRIKSATLLWRLEWALGFAIAAGFVAIDLHNLTAVVLLGGIALILGRAESGYVRHLDAYAAWERGEHTRVIDLVRNLPDYLDKSDRRALLELGIFSAIERGDDVALEQIAAELPAYRPVSLRAAERLLDRNRPFGGKLAERALDALASEVVKPSAEEKEHFAHLAFRFALYEARALRADSALGLLEKAIELGYSDLDRLLADIDLAPLSSHPRWRHTIARIAPAGATGEVSDAAERPASS